MCAINGITKNDIELIKRMNEATKHRGPDGSNIYENQKVTLGHNRLAIIDLSDAGSQPRISNDGRYVIVFNGEIYNYRELKEELRNIYDFKSQTDTEVLLAAYLTWGVEALGRLRGIFAFGIWDNKTEELVLVRDQMGVKPMYYALKEDALAFSSELNGVMVAVDQRKIGFDSLSLYLGMHYVSSPKTLVAGVNKLMPGYLLRWRKGLPIEISRYFKPEVSNKSVSDIEIRGVIDAAVKKQLVSDRPVGAFISGGFDSSIVLHHMSQYSDKVRTFSVGFEMVKGAESEAEKFNSDSVLAKKTADYYGAEHTNFDISLEVIRSSLENILANIDEPTANPTVVSQYLLSKWVRESGVVVTLGGDGGDELFGGYNRHRAFVSSYLFQTLPKLAQAPLVKLNQRFSKLTLSLPLGLHQGLMLGSETKINSVLKRELSIDSVFNEVFSTKYQEYKEIKNSIDRFLIVDRETWLADESLSRSDRTSMAHGLELRVPMLDLDVVKIADQISIWKKTWPHQGKRVIRRAYRGVLPEYLFDQPKRGWISPGAKWLRDPVINSFAKSVFSSSYYNGLDNLFDWDKVRAMLDRHANDNEYHLYPLWNILSLQIWARKNSVVAE